jgi:hypothetical protein
LGLFFPWWTIAVAGFSSGIFIAMAPWKSFLAGFCGVFLWWGGLAGLIDVKNDHILSSRIAEVFHLHGNYFLLLLLTALIGALVGGLSALTASLIRKKSQTA